jgi:hypothetical protein
MKQETLVYLKEKGYDSSIVQNKDTSIYSPNSPTVVNSKGGKQSHLPCRLDLICPKTLIRMGEILDSGAVKYGEHNWKNIPTQDHINHALVHIYGFLDGNTDDDHLGHALTRVMFALSMELNKPYGE